jgi:hypothetical protein
VSAAEIYDRVSAVTADYNYTLTIKPQGTVSEESQKNGVAHVGADGSEERVAFGTANIFYITIGWNILSGANSGTIFDLYNDPAKANGCQRSFYITYGDGHTYTVRFDCVLPRQGSAPSRYAISGVRLKILGRVNDP